MKSSHPDLRFSLRAILAAVLCLAFIPPVMARPVDYAEPGIAAVSGLQPVAPAAGRAMPLMVAEGVADESNSATGHPESDADQEAAMAAKREEMIEYCKDNRGVDCERKVDIELEAQQYGGTNVQVAPDQPNRPVRPRPRPRTYH